MYKIIQKYSVLAEFFWAAHSLTFAHLRLTHDSQRESYAKNIAASQFCEEKIRAIFGAFAHGSQLSEHRLLSNLPIEF